MAYKRMFAAAVIESDAFFDLPPKSQALYLHLCMRADDDGFVYPKSVMRSFGCTERYLNPLVKAGFVIPFDSGVACIADWKIHNNVPEKWYTPTACRSEAAQLSETPTGRYFIPIA